MESRIPKNNGGIIRAVVEIVIVLAGLYAGGSALTAMGTMMNGTSSPFYNGLGIIGGTVGNHFVNASSGTVQQTDVTIRDIHTGNKPIVILRHKHGRLRNPSSSRNLRNHSSDRKIRQDTKI